MYVVLAVCDIMCTKTSDIRTTPLNIARMTHLCAKLWMFKSYHYFSYLSVNIINQHDQYENKYIKTILTTNKIGLWLNNNMIMKASSVIKTSTWPLAFTSVKLVWVSTAWMPIAQMASPLWLSWTVDIDGQLQNNLSAYNYLGSTCLDERVLTTN